MHETEALVREKYNSPAMVKAMNSIAFSGLENEESEIIKCVIGAKKGNVLVIGSGCGREAIELKKMGFNVSGIDVSAKMVEKARENSGKLGLHIKFAVASANSTGFPGNSFDYAIAFARVIEHIPAKAKRTRALEEIKRVLKPNGIAIIDAMNSTLASELFTIPYAVLLPFCEKERWRHETSQISIPVWKYYFGRYVFSAKNTIARIIKNIFFEMERRINGQGLEQRDFFLKPSVPGFRGKLYFHSHTTSEMKSIIKESGFVLKDYKSRLELVKSPFGTPFLRNLDVEHFYVLSKPAH